MSDTALGRPPKMKIGYTVVDFASHGDVLTAVSTRLMAGAGRPLGIASVNLDHLHHFARNSGNSLTGRSVNWLMLADGAPIAMCGRRLSGRHWPRLTGADLLPDVLTLSAEHGASVGFLGGFEEMHRSLQDVLSNRWPELGGAQMWAPARDTITDPVLAGHLAQEVADAKVDVLVVGLGKPLQELWIEQFGHDSEAKVILAFGASADFLAGRVQRAPEVMQNLGGEWLFRLVKEPRRLARRYLVEAPAQLKLLRSARLVDSEFNQDESEIS
ncbi:WecB/TagA/CpsF family glycosyltransferase [Gordonia sp. NPDC003424]